MKAVHFGAGNIGRGFIGELLYESGFSTTFVDVVKATVDYINETNSYEMYIIDNNEKKVIKNVKAFSPITNEADIVEAICEADLITTSVCVDNLDKIAPTLAKGLKERLNRGIGKVDVMACENAFYATDMLKKALVENTKAPVTEEELDKVGAFPNVAVDRIALSTVINGVRVPQIQAAFELVIEKDKMVNPEAQPIKGAEYVENLGMYLERKLYVFNCKKQNVRQTKKTIPHSVGRRMVLAKAITDRLFGNRFCRTIISPDLVAAHRSIRSLSDRCLASRNLRLIPRNPRFPTCCRNLLHPDRRHRIVHRTYRSTTG